MLYLVGGLVVLSVAQSVLLARVYLRTREAGRLDDRLAHFAEALALLTDTTEAGFANIAGELEVRRKTSRTGSRAAISKRISSAVRRGRSLEEIASRESLSESEIRLHLGLAGGDGAAASSDRRGARSRAVLHIEPVPASAGRLDSAYADEESA